jgi:hypothetical protein
MYAVQQPLPASAFGDVMGVPAWKTLPSWYLVAADDQALPPDAERMFARREVPAVPAPVLTQAWRGGSRYVLLARLLTGCHTEPLDDPGARAAGTLAAAISRRLEIDHP